MELFNRFYHLKNMLTNLKILADEEVYMKKYAKQIKII